MSSIYSIALSGLNAASLRLDASASNVANIDSDGTVPDPKTGAVGAPAPYQPLDVAQEPLTTGGTVANVTSRQPAYTVQYSPWSPYADPNGLVGAPNVDLATEAVNQITAVNAYKANLQVIKVADEIDQETIDSLDTPTRSLTA
ncbi:MAG: flagellar biosynthesis protein FlgC [Alphaproteobacteria bacterium]|nr:flagellar biosynthesis protein FlgC [Alphaproteobacteria bacterium]